VAELIGREAGKKIEARRVPVEAVIEKNPSLAARGDYALLALQRLLNYYDRYGLSGNSNVLGWLLGRAPGDYAAYVRRELADKNPVR
jgi:hypothetical protein